GGGRGRRGRVGRSVGGRHDGVGAGTGLGGPHAAPASQGVTGRPGPAAMLRSPAYVRLLVVAAILGVPISAAAYGFLALVSYLQKELFIHLPHGLGYSTAPACC